MRWRFTDTMLQWRGPAPYWFVALPPDACEQIDAEKARLTYGWGVIPVTARIGDTEFTTSLFPRDGAYLLPLKVAVRRAEQLDTVTRWTSRCASASEDAATGPRTFRTVAGMPPAVDLREP